MSDGDGIGMVIKGGGSQRKTTVQGQPNGGKAENCAIVLDIITDAGPWGDIPCTAGYYFVS